MEKRSSNPDNNPLFFTPNIFMKGFNGLAYISQVLEMTATRIIINAIFGTSSTIGLIF